MENIKAKFYKSSLIITFIVIVGKMVGIVRDSLIAKNFGLSYMNDVYMFSIGTTMLFISLGYGLTTALIPIHTKIIEKESIEYRNNFANNIINVTFLVTIVIVISGYIFSGAIVKYFAPAFTENPNIFYEAKTLVRIMFFSLLFVGVQSVIAGINQCHKEFKEAASMSIFSNLIYIVYLVLFIGKFGLIGFGYATVFGFFSMLLVNIPKYKKLGYRYKLYVNMNDENLRKLFKLMLPIMLSSSLIQINLFIVRAFAGRLEYGSISSLDYANKINMIVYEVFAVAINMVIYPTLASLSATKDFNGYSNSLIKGFNLINIIMIPAAVGVFLLREPIIMLYLKRGAFGEKEVIMTSNILIYYVPSMTAYGIRELLNRGLYSLGNNKVPVINSFINIILNFVLCIILIFPLKAAGLALGNSLAVLISNIFLFISVSKKLQNFSYNKVFIPTAKIIISAFLMGIVVYSLNKYILLFPIKEAVRNLIALIMCGLCGSFIYFLVLYLLKIDKTVSLKNLIKK